MKATYLCTNLLERDEEEFEAVDVAGRRSDCREEGLSDTVDAPSQLASEVAGVDATLGSGRRCANDDDDDDSDSAKDDCLL